MRYGLLTFFFLGIAVPVCHAQTGSAILDIEADACETLIGDESKASARYRATDKAVFSGIKKLKRLDHARSILDDQELNVMVYRLVDEYVGDFSSETTRDEDGKICVKVRGKLDPMNIAEVEKNFIRDETPISEPTPEVVAQAAAEATAQVDLKPSDPDSMALIYVRKLRYFNGSETSKFVPELKESLRDNPYFYLTDEEELADYVLTPKVLKAKVDSLDATHKRLQMVVSIEMTGLEPEPVNTYQNRFVLFGAEDDEQRMAARLIRKLLENAGDEARRRLERHEQLKFEKKTLGKTISE